MGNGNTKQSIEPGQIFTQTDSIGSAILNLLNNSSFNAAFNALTPDSSRSEFELVSDYFKSLNRSLTRLGLQGSRITWALADGTLGASGNSGYRNFSNGTVPVPTGDFSLLTSVVALIPTSGDPVSGPNNFVQDKKNNTVQVSQSVAWTTGVLCVSGSLPVKYVKSDRKRRC